MSIAKKRALTAHLVGSGGYLPATPSGRVRRVPRGAIGIWCEACEWAVVVSVSSNPKRGLGVERAEDLRRQHVTNVHHDLRLVGAMVVDPELAE